MSALRLSGPLPALVVAIAVSACSAPDPAVRQAVVAPPPKPRPVTLTVPAPRHIPRDAVDPEQLHCLALTVYWEGRSESREGQIAIAQVVLNRVADSRFPDTICGVVKQDNTANPRVCQFSWWCDGKSDAPTEEKAWQEALEIARAAAAGDAADPTDGALYFHLHSISPDWAEGVERTAMIGAHVFYR